MNKLAITAEQHEALANAAPPVIQFSAWEVKELVLSWEKVDVLWNIVKEYRSIFSDLTRDDKANFVRLLASPESYWLEAYENGRLNALVYLTNLTGVEAIGHLIVLDRDAASKAELVRRIAKYIFDTFPVNRITAPTPAMYFATLRMLKKAGFTEEGVRRQAVVMEGKWRDIVVFGILRNEVEHEFSLRQNDQASGSPA